MRLLALILILTAAALALVPPEWIPATNGTPPTADWLPGPFQKLATPILTPSKDGLDDKNTYNMAVVKDNGTFRMLYRGESTKEAKNEITGRLFLAESADGRHFTRDPEPVFTPTESYESHGVEDPRLVCVNATYYLTYTGYDGSIARLCLATSPDLRHWTKDGPIFPHFPVTTEHRYAENWTKSGAILPVPLQDGKYRMVFGDSDLWLATSSDLHHWDYRPEPILKVRPDHRDCGLIEAGPPLMLTNRGILMLYNSADRQNHYAVFAALLDVRDPAHVLERTETPLLEPTLGWEQAGYVPFVTFAEALVPDGDHFNLYYGGADRCIGLARAPLIR